MSDSCGCKLAWMLGTSKISCVAVHAEGSAGKLSNNRDFKHPRARWSVAVAIQAFSSSVMALDPIPSSWIAAAGKTKLPWANAGVLFGTFANFLYTCIATRGQRYKGSAGGCGAILIPCKQHD